MPHRCAFGCKNTDVVMHVFPKPDKYPERFKVWVNLVGGKPEEMSDFEFYKKKRVCDIHFPDEVRVRCKRVSAIAIPSLHLPGVAMSQDAENIGTIQPGKENPTAINQSDGTTISQAPMDIGEYQPSNQTAYIKELVVCQGSRSAACLISEHNYSTISSQKTIRKDAQEKTATCCCENDNLKKKIRYLQSEVNRLRKKTQIFQQRLANARKLTNEVSFLQVAKHMTKPAQLLVHMQLQTNKKPKGRRFSIEEKKLCVSLFKNSPQSYRLLSKFFTLPSKKAMKRLSEVKLIPELNSV